MRRTSLAEAKAHLSQLVDEAEHHHRKILILRHGKPAAAIVPVDTLEERTVPPPMSSKEASRFLDGFLTHGSRTACAVEDLLGGRR